MGIIIKGLGSYIPENKMDNEAFLNHEFYDENGKKLAQNNETIIRKFTEITGITSRRYISENMLNSEMGTIAAKKAIADAKIDVEELDLIIFAHNFGNIPHNLVQTDILPCLATRVKHDLQIHNPNCVAFDLIYGCPGWLQAMLVARQNIMSKEAKNVLIVGAEALSRVVDPFDRDSMIYADGAGAAVISENNVEDQGIISVASQTFANEEAYHLFYGKSYKADYQPENRFIKMHGRKIYEFALNNVPQAMKACLDKSGLPIEHLKMVFIHQANEKMDEAIIERFYKLYGKDELPEYIMPMSIHELGNSSVATVPTLLDLVLRKKIENHQINRGDLILLASVGAGMSINALTYRV